jgi:hypothetical protein
MATDAQAKANTNANPNPNPIEQAPTSPAIDPTKVKGWGIDADPENDPTYPYRQRHPGDGAHAGYTWERPPQQPIAVEVLRSIERPNVSAAFGDGPRPTGLSGLIRRLAFRSSESSYLHWVPLMLADRVDAVEGVIDDLSAGRIPNLFEERGWKADWRHNRPALIAKVTVGALAAGIAVGWLASRSKPKARGVARS